MDGTAGFSKNLKNQRCWRKFVPGSWCSSIDVRGFIVRNAKPYTGDEKVRVGPTQRTKAVWEKLQPYFKEERKNGALAVDAERPSTMLKRGLSCPADRRISRR